MMPISVFGVLLLSVRDLTCFLFKFQFSHLATFSQADACESLLWPFLGFSCETAVSLNSTF